ncbi:MAG: 30S ribosomal protein S6e [Candidatus Lokiarchaeota archaeon]|nr:30S ribosomal protein S6e [Candidatus Lokiarchaeota archaeon]
MKLVISDPKLGRTIQKEVEEEKLRPFLGKKIGDTISGGVIDFPGYEFRITGGSDEDGTPMRPDVRGPTRKRILITKGVGLRKNKIKRDGNRVKKMVRGNQIVEEIVQINLVITKQGKKPIIETQKEEEKEEKE